jgi:predicted membrane chloride channel (bestrophin family)
LGAFAIATKLHLRKESVNTELEALLTPSQILQLKRVKTSSRSHRWIAVTYNSSSSVIA